MGVKQIVVCDACGRENPGEHSSLNVTVGSRMDAPYDTEYIKEQRDLCHACAMKVLHRVVAKAGGKEAKATIDFIDETLRKSQTTKQETSR